MKSNRFFGRKWIKTVLVVLLFQPIYARENPWGWNNDSYRALDSAFGLMEIPLADFNLPSDYLLRDSFRFPWIQSGFSNPFGLFKGGSFMDSNLVKNRKVIQKMAQFVFAEAFSTTHISSAGSFKNFFKKEIKDKKFKSEMAKIESEISKLSLGKNTKAGLFHLISDVVASCIWIDNWKGQFKPESLRHLMEMSDSLLMEDEDVTELDVFSLKERELEDYVKAERFFETAGEVDLKPLWILGLYWETKLPALKQWLWEQHAKGRWLSAPVSMSTPWGKIYLGDSTDNRYTESALLILDPAGNDIYHAGFFSKDTLLGFPVRIQVDVSGNDIYKGDDFSFGGSFFGLSAFLDGAGNDVYSTGRFSLGACLWGISLFIEEAGNDVYLSKSNSQGSAAFGAALFEDLEGDDLYQCEGQCQGFGFTSGFGLMLDLKGHDKYIAASPVQDVLRYDDHYVTFSQGAGLGYRPIASGGLGWLLDLSGNDIYVSDIFGQGTGYWYSHGLLYDAEGRDSYQAHQYAQGAGVHLAFGTLRDKNGNDKYQSHGVGQGCGHDLAFGALLDESGDDNYSAYGLSLGGGNANGLSFFMDTKGDDNYSIRTEYNSLGYSDWRRDFGMLGIFVDGAGKDLYSSYEGKKENYFKFKSSLGFFSDFDFNFSAPKTPDAVRLLDFTLAKSPESLFVQASTAPEKFRSMVAPARKAYVDMGEYGLKYLKEKMGSVFPRDKHALRDIVDSLYSKIPQKISKWLADSLESKNPHGKLMSAELCGRTQSKACAKGLLKMAGDSNWVFRQSAIWNLGKLKETENKAPLLKFLNDKRPLVAARAAYGLGLIHARLSAGDLNKILNKKHFLVETGFREGVQKSEKEFSPELFWRVWKSSREGRRYGLLALLSCLTPDSLKDYNPGLKGFQLTKKEKSYLKAFLQGDKNWEPFLITRTK